jgi:hypothetical protein
MKPPGPLALALFVLWVLCADYSHNPAALDHFAVVATLFD